MGDQVFDIHFSCNKQKLDDLFVESANDNTVDNIIDEVIKRITKNDVRARILRIPSEYKNDLKGKKKYKLIINGNSEEYFNISSDERYFGGITNIIKHLLKIMILLMHNLYGNLINKMK